MERVEEFCRRLNIKYSEEVAARIRVYRRGEDVKILMDRARMHPKGMCFGSAGSRRI